MAKNCSFLYNVWWLSSQYLLIKSMHFSDFHITSRNNDKEIIKERNEWMLNVYRLGKLGWSGVFLYFSCDKEGLQLMIILIFHYALD